MAKRKKFWIRGALGVRRRRLGLGPHHVKAVRTEGRHKGALRRMLGVRKTQRRIPRELLAWAARQPGLLGQRARFAITARKFKHGRHARRRG